MPGSKITVEKVLHALADPTRRAMVEMLSRRPHSVSYLAEPLGITLTAVGQHLQVLEECGLAHTEKTGRVRVCRLETRGLTILEQWARDRRSLWEQRLDALSRLLEEE